ncbi:hypothetical protein DAMA08_012070 [Martiniozyma asiatica (nom. inval.)]|nr:hypothetical protein DAMA08_012070 [Martiniozyma asiatica]
MKEEIRPLTFGTLNFLHTTDTHGWYLGHTNQRQYSSDWGDFLSFHLNLKNLINNKQHGDLLLVDTGDRHDGNGLSDMTSPNGQLSNEIFLMADYDLVTVGNHELYRADVSTLEYETTVKYYGERFISTNVEYLNDSNKWVVFGNSTHRYFKTEINNYTILALSFMFDFHLGNERVRVKPIDELIYEHWFINLLKKYQKQPVDALVIFGHMPVTKDWKEFIVLHNFLRSFFPSTQIQYFGGHSHIRDFSILDNKATGLQSGRYCETVGFLSIQNLQYNESVHSNVFRRYIDFNLHSFTNHTGFYNLEDFNTEKGLFTSKEVGKYSNNLGLDEVYGYVPQNYYIAAADYINKDERSLLRFLEDEILIQLEPKICDEKNGQLYQRSNNSRVIIINTGGVRYDLYKGEFTKNALFTVSPFKNMWRVIPSVDKTIALRLKAILNEGQIILSESQLQLKSPYQNAINLMIETNKIQSSLKEKSSLSYGYNTIDDFGADGDDTVHKALQFHYVPNVIQSYEEGSTDKIDVVFYDFIEPFIFNALLKACDNNENLFAELSSTTRFYNDCAYESNVGELLKRYAQSKWN